MRQWRKLVFRKLLSPSLSYLCYVLLCTFLLLRTSHNSCFLEDSLLASATQSSNSLLLPSPAVGLNLTVERLLFTPPDLLHHGEKKESLLSSSINAHVHVAIAANGNYLLPLVAAVYSVQTHSSFPIYFHIITSLPTSEHSSSTSISVATLARALSSFLHEKNRFEIVRVDAEPLQRLVSNRCKQPGLQRERCCVGELSKTDQHLVLTGLN